MAEGRMVNRTVATDERLNGMSRDAMLLYLMAVPHLDRDGLIDGRPRVLWATVAPLQDEWLHAAAALVDEWVAAGLVVRYFDADRPILFFAGFAKNQSRMHYQRERESKFPCPPGFVRTPAGLSPAVDAVQANEAPARDEVARNSRVGRALNDTDTEFARDEVATNSRVGRALNDTDTESARDEVATNSRLGRALNDSDDESARDEVATNSRLGRAEDQDQTEDQDQHQDECVGGGDHSSTHPRLGNGGMCEGGTLCEAPPAAAAYPPGAAPPGDLVRAFTLEQLRTAAYQLGSLLGLHMEWTGYAGFVARREAGSLAVLLEWIEFYRAMPPPALERVDNLPGLIRSHLNKGDLAPLTGAQRKALAAAVVNALAVVEEAET